MENFRNYYEILGVSQESSQQDIKQAYRRLARQYHPDLNPNDAAAEDMFKQVGEAYGVLSDPEKRSQYEDYSRFWQQQGFQGIRFNWSRKPGAATRADVDFAAFRDFDKFVDQVLNQHQDNAPRQDSPFHTSSPVPNPPQEPPNRRPPVRDPNRSAPANRRDAEADLVLPLEKAYAGGRERIRLEDGRSLEVNMPMGMVTGQRIRLRGQGIGGGNLYLRIEIKPHRFFRLQGSDVTCRLPLTPSEAALGGALEVPTLGGPVSVVLPAGVQPGHQIRMEGHGYPIGRERRGDQILELQVVVPRTLTDREKALYRELRETETFNPRANLPVSPALG